MEEKKEGFFKKHGDSIAIISVNLVIGSILSGMFISNVSRIDATNARTDQLYQMFVETQKDIYELRADFNEKFYELIERGKK